MSTVFGVDKLESFIATVLRDALPDEAEIVGDRRLQHVAASAVAHKSFEEAFDVKERGAPLAVVETLQLLLVGAQIVLVLREIWNKAAGMSRRDFEARAEHERRKLDIKNEMLPLWEKLLGKVYDLVTKSPLGGK